MPEIQSGAAVQQGGRIRDITGYQWLVLFIAWAAGRLDITDFNPVRAGAAPSLDRIARRKPDTGADRVGWRPGHDGRPARMGRSAGFVFGITADYLGRVRTLALSI